MSNNIKKIPVLLLLFSFESTSSVIASHWGGMCKRLNTSK